MQSKNSRSEYMTAVLAVRRARIVNLVLCALGAALTAGAAVWFYPTAYKLTALCLAGAAVLFLAALAFKNARELRAVTRIASAGIYAAKLTAQQQRDIRRAQVNEGRRFSFTAFLIIATLEALALTVLYIISKSEIFLLFLAGFTLVSFGAAVLSPLYLAARLSQKHAFFTLSENGALLAGEVLPFRAQKGDALELLHFEDYDLLRLRREAIFGIPWRTRLLFPADGALKKGIDGPAPRAVAAALGLSGAREMGVTYYESRDYADNGGERRPEKKKEEALA